MSEHEHNQNTEHKQNTCSEHKIHSTQASLLLRHDIRICKVKNQTCATTDTFRNKYIFKKCKCRFSKKGPKTSFLSVSFFGFFEKAAENIF